MARRAAAGRSLGWRAKLLALLALAGCAGAGYVLWLRDSELVAVTDVEVVGVRAGERERIVDELTAAAKQMTTLHLDREQLDRIGAGFPTIASLSADPNFPHGLRIEVTERPPALVAKNGAEEVAVAADGTVLPGVEAPDGLPTIEMAKPPGAGRLKGAALDQALIAGAAPASLAPLIEGIAERRNYGVELELRGGIPVRFGDAGEAEAKWAATAAVLADPKLTALSYLDVRVPERPALGG